MSLMLAAPVTPPRRNLAQLVESRRDPLAHAMRGWDKYKNLPEPRLLKAAQDVIERSFRHAAHELTHLFSGIALGATLVMDAVGVAAHVAENGDLGNGLLIASIFSVGLFGATYAFSHLHFEPIVEAQIGTRPDKSFGVRPGAPGSALLHSRAARKIDALIAMRPAAQTPPPEAPKLAA